MNKGIALRLSALILLLSSLFFMGCREDRYEYCEIGIRLDGEYRELDTDGAFDLAFSNGSTVVGIYRVSFEAAVDEGIPVTMSALKFAEYYLGLTEKDAEVEEEGTVAYYTYTSLDESGKTYIYTPTFFRTPYAYFVITFIGELADEEEQVDHFLGLAKTVYLID